MIVAEDIPWADGGAGGGAASVLASSAPPLIDWPAPLAPIAFHGVVGDLVRLVQPHTEADPAALLLQGLVIFGNILGPVPHFVAEGSRHRLVLYLVLVGTTAKGRKGSSYRTLSHVFTTIDDTLRDPHRVVSGMSSGEGLIAAVRDEVVTGATITDAGVSDKRLLVLEEEYASVLRVMGREGNNLSAVIRQAWDTGDLGTLTKSNRVKATGAYISIIGHVTKDELRRYLDRTEAGNGFGNRFLWACAKRSNLLPEGGALHTVDFGDIGRRLMACVEFGRNVGELRRTPDAKELWARVYPELSEGQPGMFGAMTSRAEAQVMRLACLYAVGDMSYVVKPTHLNAALEVWRYCADSARFVFGASLGDPVADELDAALLHAGCEGRTRTEIRDLFNKNARKAEVDRALTLLIEHGRVRRDYERTGSGRPVERWIHLRSLL